MFVRKKELNTERSNTETIKRWINNINEFEKKIEKMPKMTQDSILKHKIF